jgi:hypothetical protein
MATPMPAQFQRRRVSALVRVAGSAVMLTAAVIGLAGATSWTSSARAQAPGGSGGDVALPLPGEVTGQDFAGLRLAATPHRGVIEMSAQRGAVWTVEPRRGPEAGTTLGAPVQRVLLRGDVRVTFGRQRFSAAQAVLWIERLETSARDPRGSVYQVAAYFDRVGDPGGMSGSTQVGDRLLVTGLIDAPAGQPALALDSLASVVPDAESAPFVVESEQRLSRFLLELITPRGQEVEGNFDTRTFDLANPMVGPIVPGQSQPYEPGSPLSDERLRQTRSALLERARARGEGIATDGLGEPLPDAGSRRAIATGPLFSSAGFVTVSARDPVLVQGTGEQGESTLLATGGVVVQYADTRLGRSLEVSAERVVVFFKPGALADVLRTPASAVRGFYLEGNVVATDGTSTLRGPRVYYDLENNRAYMIDGVFWTYDERRGLPLYVRARTIAQTAANQVRATDVRVSSSSFFEPQLAIGASDVTITREAPPGEVAATILDAKNTTLRAGGVPVLWWPGFRGDVDRYLLREVSLENSSATGFGARTRWDLFGILGVNAPKEYQADLLLDAATERGFGGGARAAWNTINNAGTAYGYVIPDDRSSDRTPSGTDIENDGRTRGAVLFDNRWKLSDTWSLFTQAAYVSDPTFLFANDRTLTQNRRELTTSAELRGTSDNATFSATAKGTLNDFISNQDILQSQGYYVQKLPELAYIRVADDLFAGISPGLLNWSHEYRVSRMSLRFDDTTLKDLGFNTTSLAQQALGLGPNDSLERVLKGRGFIDDDVTRLDTRQQLDLTYQAGPVTITPFLTGRATFWDDKFRAFAGEDEDRLRLFGAAGVRASTTFARVYNGVEVGWLDISRIRHIVTPSVTAMASGATRPQSSLPIYDDGVEALSSGRTVRFGVDQVFQTQRGGPGRARSVDLLKVSTDLVLSTDSTDTRSPIRRFFDPQPELSQLGDFQTTDAVLQVTDAVALTFANIYDLDVQQNARTTAGLQTQHSADFSSFLELRYINARDVTYVASGLNLRLTPFYTGTLVSTYDTTEGELQTIGVGLTREFPSVLASLTLGYNNIDEETGFGVKIVPLLEDRRAAAIRRINPNDLSREVAEGAGGAEGGLSAMGPGTGSPIGIPGDVTPGTRRLPLDTVVPSTRPR